MGGKALYVETPTKKLASTRNTKKRDGFYEGTGFVVERVKKEGEPDNNCGCDMAIMKKVLA